MSFSSEFQLAAACARWPRSDARTSAIADAATRGVDWRIFLQVVRRHRVTALAHQGLADATTPAPAWVREELATDALAMASRNLTMLAETIRLQRLFSSAQLPVLFLKGIPLAISAFGSVAMRHAKDIDVLIAPALVGTAAAILEEAGYARHVPPPEVMGRHLDTWYQEFHDFSYRHPITRVEIELHWRPFRNRHVVRVPTVNDDVGVRLNDVDVRTLGRADALTYLCAHGAMHGWFRLKWLADVNAVIAQERDSDVESLYEAAVGRGGELLVGQGLLLCREILATPIPSRLLERLRAHRRVARLAARMLEPMHAPQFHTEQEGWPLMARLRMKRNALQLGDWRFLAASARAQLVLQEDVCALPLPKGAAFLYPIIRPYFWARQRLLHDSRH